MTYRQKESLYRSLAQLLRAGVPFPAALDKLSTTARGPVRRVLAAMREAVARGQGVGEAFAAQRGEVGALEASAIGAVERSGRLEHGMQQLALYFAALARARETVLRKAAYPIFMLHFGILLLGAPTLVNAGVGAFLREIGLLLGVVYGLAITAALLVPMLREAGATNASLDALLRRLPLIGKVRRAFAVARFCLIYDVQLEAGVNVMDALGSAGKASRSGLIAEACQRAIPEVRGGGSVGPLLAVGGAFPEEMMRAFLVAEETGGLDKELPRLATEAQEEALVRLDTAVEWGSKFLLIAVVAYLGWRIVSFWMGYYSQIGKILGE